MFKFKEIRDRLHLSFHKKFPDAYSRYTLRSAFRPETRDEREQSDVAHELLRMIAPRQEKELLYALFLLLPRWKSTFPIDRIKTTQKHCDDCKRAMTILMHKVKDSTGRTQKLTGNYHGSPFTVSLQNKCIGGRRGLYVELEKLKTEHGFSYSMKHEELDRLFMILEWNFKIVYKIPFKNNNASGPPGFYVLNLSGYGGDWTEEKQLGIFVELGAIPPSLEARQAKQRYLAWREAHTSGEFWCKLCDLPKKMEEKYINSVNKSPGDKLHGLCVACYKQHYECASV